MRVADKELSILTGPLYSCLNDLAVTGGQTDIQCLMAQLQLVGQQLEVIEQYFFQKFFFQNQKKMLPIFFSKIQK